MSLEVHKAKNEVIAKALEYIEYTVFPSQRESDSPNYAAHCAYLEDELFLAAKRLVKAVDQLPEINKPGGWDKV